MTVCVLLTSGASRRTQVQSASKPEVMEISDQTSTNVIQQHREFLEERMDPDFGLLDKLFANGTISPREASCVKDKSPFQERNSQLLDYIVQNHQQDRLFEALRNSGQTHIVNYLKANGEDNGDYGEDWPLRDSEISILTTNQESLVDLLELIDLLSLLYASNVINKRQKESISSKQTSYAKNDELLNILRRRSIRDYNITIENLHDTKQSHIARLFEDGGVVVRVHAHLDGENIDEAENEIATKIAGMSVVQRNRILELLQHKVIAAKTGQSIVLYIYCQTIEELQELHKSLISGGLKDSAELCFDVLLKRPQKIASLTISDEEFQKMQMYFKDMSSDDQAEGTTMKEGMTSRATSEAEEKIKLRATHDFDPDRMTRRETEELRNIVYRGRIKRQNKPYMALKFKRGDKMETFPSTNIGETNRWWKVSHLESGKIGFIPKDRVVIETDCQPSMTTLNELPLELLDVVLEKSLLHCILNPSFHQKDEDVVKDLASVDFCWFQRITRRRFKKRIWRRLKDFYGKTRKSSAIVRNNRSYLLDNILSNYKLIASMLSFNCITEKQRNIIQRQGSNCNDNKKKEQSHFIQRLRSKQDKNSEMLHQMRSFDETKHSNFVKCLRQTNQKTVARIIENGGGVMKVEVQYRSAKCTKSSEAQLLLHENIEDLRSRTKPWSRQTDKLISQLREEGIDILNSHLDRQTVVVWIWCHSQAALDHIQRVYESNQLRDVLFGLGNIPEIDQSKVINIDSNQFKKAVVMRPISINFNQAIDVGRDDDVYGVTKLRSEIYVLCPPSSPGTTVIRVFEDRNPFDLKKKIEIKEMKHPVDIGSSEKENCLYVSDSWEICVWKIIRETDDEHKIIKWLTTDYQPWTLSVSSKGQLLLANHSSSSLMIYGSDAEFIRSIQLPTDTRNLYHAVETSIGNFIICYEEQLEEQDEEEKDEKEEKEEKEEEEKGEGEEEKEEQKEAEEKEGEEDEEREEEKEGDSGSRGRNSIKVEKNEEEEATEGEVEEGEEEDMEEKRKVKEDKEWGEEIEGESASNGKNSIKVEKEEDEEEEGKEEEGGKRDRVEEQEKKSGSSWRKKKRNFAIIELSRDGQMVIRRFLPSKETQELIHPYYLSHDSDDRVFVADSGNDKVILLDSDLKWNRILCPTEEETEETKIRNLYSVLYDEEKKQLIVGGEGVNVYTLSRK